MTDYISREAALQSLCSECNCKEYCDQTGDKCRDYGGLTIIPAADVVPVVHGRWVYNPGDNIPYCSECMMPQDSECNFCPTCGAKMDGGEKGELPATY